MAPGNSSHTFEEVGRQPGQGLERPAPVVITPLCDADVNEAARLCFEVFLYDEPTTRRIAPDPVRVFPESVWYVQSLVGRGLSFVAQNEQTHEIAGIVFSFDLTDDFSPDHERFTAFFDNFRPAIAMIDELEARYLDRSWCSPGFVLHAFQGGVRREYRRSGVLTALVDRMIAAARERGFHKIVADCTSPESQQALERCGFRQAGFLGYDAFFIDGVRYFHGLNGGLSLMVKDL
jgi:RimJ/RimL family protein N-acetyltransferase